MNLENGEIGVRVIADEMRFIIRAVGKRGTDAGRAFHDVAVRQNESVGSKYNSRPASRWCFICPCALPSAARGTSHRDGKVRDRWSNALHRSNDGRRIRVEYLGVVDRDRGARTFGLVFGGISCQPQHLHRKNSRNCTA